MSLQRSELVNMLEITDFVSLFFSKACISIDSFVRTCATVADTLTAGQVRPKLSGGKLLRKNFAFGEISL